ncbi:MAG: PAS domain-containing protein [Pseudomonadota bacterium]
MDTEERLREALLDLDRARQQERQALRESNALLDGLEGISTAETPAAAVEALLSSVQTSLGADAAILLHGAGPAPVRHLSTVAATTQKLSVQGPEAAKYLSRHRRRIVDLGMVQPAPIVAAYRSMLSAPAAFGANDVLVLVCLGTALDLFDQADLRILDRLTGLAAQALTAKQLAEEKRLLAEVIDGSSTSFAIADAEDDGRPLIYVNEAFEILTGYTRDEVLGQNCRFLAAEPPGSPERRRLNECVRDRVAGQFELLNRRRDGDAFWNRLTLYPVTVGGDRTYLVATQEDITRARQVQLEGDAARNQLMSALGSTREGFLMIGTNGRVRIANARYREFFGTQTGAWDTDKLFTDAWAQWLSHGGEEAARAAQDAAAMLAQMLAGGTPWEETLPDGRIVLVNATAMPEEGAVVVVTDVTALKTTERQLNERIVAIDVAQDGIAITDERGRFVYLNPSHVRMFGYDDQSELLGQSWELLYGPAERAQLQEIAMPALAKIGTWRGDIAGRRRDGSPVQQDVALTMLDGVGLVCVTRDISERIRGEQERLKLREQLHVAQRQEAIGQLAAGIAHDFNNVLAVINGSARLLAIDAGDDQVSPHLGRILAAGEQATSLIARMLDFGGRDEERRWTDLREAFGQAVELIQSGLPMGISLEVLQPEAPVQAYVDRTHVTQIVLNLAINARDAMPAEGGRISLSLSEPMTCPVDVAPQIGELRANERYVRARVQDSGSGMAPETLVEMFQPYYSTKGDHGTGLGLAVVASIVRGTDGAIDVRSELGYGTTFDVYLPISEQAPRDQSVAPTDGRRDLKGLRLIVVDDDPNVAETIAQILEINGAETTVCEDPRDALSSIEEDPQEWHGVITDYDMPTMTGAELAQKIAAVTPNLRIVLVTALPGWQGRKQTLGTPFSDILSKPVDPHKLVVAVAKCWDSGPDRDEDT